MGKESKSTAFKATVAKTTTTAKTSTQGTKHEQKITRKKELFLLFWVDENDSGRKMFYEAAQTRLIIIKTEPWYNENIHKVHCPNIKSFSQIQKSIDHWINHYGGSESITMKEVSFFSHSGLDGPIIYNASKHDPFDLLIQPKRGRRVQMKLEHWKKINYYWDKSKECRLVFFGCNSAAGETNSFAAKLSSSLNCLNIPVIGQPKSSYPSFYPDCRFTSSARSLNTGWDIGPTYMVASDSNNGQQALFQPPNQAAIHKMIFFKNSLKTGDSFQSIFNDHRKKRSDKTYKEARIIKDWQLRFGYSQ